MCGIAGIIRENILDSDKRVIEEMKNLLEHRGPDDQGTYSDTSFSFGHRRLSIIDIEHGHQPMQTEDGRFTIVYNGEVYNYIELREELKAKGVTFKTASDTEVILKLIREEWTEGISKLNGMFAFVVFDNVEKRYLAARDSFGIKPFYYAITQDNTFIFASEIKAILAYPGIEPIVDHESLQEYFTFQFCLNNKTMFKNIHKLEPGTFLHSTINSIKTPRIDKYWELDYHVDTHHTEEYFSETIMSILQDSIKLQLRSDVEVGSYLSGGIDSSTVTALAAQHYPNKFQCFHGRFLESEDYDEMHYAKIVAKDNSCIFHEVAPTCSDFIKFLPKLIWHMDEPAAGPGLFPQYMVSKLASQNVKVVLAGTGGDEIFGGYARYYVAYLEQCLKGAIFETQEEGKHIVGLDTLINNLSLLKQYVPMLKSFWAEDLFENMDKRYFRLINRNHDTENFVHTDISNNWDHDRIFEKFQNIFHNPNTKSYLNKMTHFDQKTLLPALLQVEDRVSMACSLESRVPLLDTQLVNLVTKMAPKMKYQEGKPKFILKQSIKDLLPEKVINRKDKMGFPVPLKEWYQGDARDFIMDTLLSSKSKQRNLFQANSLENMINNEGQYSRKMWGALCLELWFETFNVKL